MWVVKIRAYNKNNKVRRRVSPAAAIQGGMQEVIMSTDQLFTGRLFLPGKQKKLANFWQQLDSDGKDDCRSE